jgi:hypothetical protein
MTAEDTILIELAALTCVSFIVIVNIDLVRPPSITKYRSNDYKNLKDTTTKVACIVRCNLQDLNLEPIV